MKAEERTYDLKEPVTFGLLEQAASALDMTVTDILEDPMSVVDQQYEAAQMQRFCVVVLEDFDLELSGFPVLEARAFFLVVLRKLFEACAAPAQMLEAVLNVSTTLRATPDSV